jgi:tetratricopeptide (TPR) repeat protein
VPDLEKALELIPNHATALINLTRILIGQKQYDQARILVDKMQDQPLALLFSSLLHYRAGDFKAAQNDATAFLPEDWSSLTTWPKEDMFLLVRDQLDWAQQVAAWGEKANWSLPSSHILLAYAHWGHTEYQASIELFDQLIEGIGSMKEQPQREWLVTALGLEQAGVGQDAHMFDFAREKYHWALERKLTIEAKRYVQNELLKIDQATQTTA